jgi:hypothetical protein
MRSITPRIYRTICLTFAILDGQAAQICLKPEASYIRRLCNLKLEA